MADIKHAMLSKILALEREKRAGETTLTSTATSPVPLSVLEKSETKIISAPSGGKEVKETCGALEKFHGDNPFFSRTVRNTVIEKLGDDDLWTKCGEKHACFFCGYSFRWAPFPMPIKIKSGKYHVDDVLYCTPNCVKSQLLACSNYYLNQRLEDLTTLLADLYNYHKPVAAVEKKIFKRYRGSVTHKQYIANTAEVCKLQVLSSPFVCEPTCIQEDFKDLVMTKPKSTGKSSKTPAKETKETKETRGEKKDKKESKAEKKEKEKKSLSTGPTKMDMSEDKKEIKDHKESKNFGDLVPVLKSTK